MTTIYIDPSGTGVGEGTLARPFASWTSVSWVPGNIYLQKRGTTHAGPFRIGASGSAALPITVGAYYRPDGMDDPAQPKPVIVLPAALAPEAGGSVAAFGQERDFITYRNLDLRNTALREASDVAILWLGNHCIFDNNDVRSNCGGVYIGGKNAVTVSNCLFDVLSCGAPFANQGIQVGGSASMDQIRLLGNTIIHRGGGSPRAHGISCETWGTGTSITNLLIANNRVMPSFGQTHNTGNRKAIGIYVANGRAARLDGNTVSGMLSGIMLASGSRNYVGNNHCSMNMNFGIHIAGDAKSFLIEGNTCNHNGGALSDTYYGRGIELSSGAGANAVSGHTIRFNTCSFNYNFGGTLDNGSEGVGIGLDDGTARCAVYGNALSYNEGNGIQLYGGANPAKYPDTGGHLIASNLLYSNCKCSVLGRRSGGTSPSPFCAHIQLSYVYGTQTMISNNIFAGNTREGIGRSDTSSNIIDVNNVNLGAVFPVPDETEILAPAP